MNNHIIFFSGGKSSFTVADWVKTHYPDDNIVLYFTDTKWEDEDLYRFINEACDKLELPMLTHADGRNPMELMFDKKLVFNSRIGDCSKILKMKVSRDYLKKGIKPNIEFWRNKQYLKHDDFITDATLYFGIGWEEMHREGAIRKNWKPFKVEMPLIDNVIDNSETLKKYGLRQPRQYDFGFAHANCASRCVKAGQGHFKLLKQKMPDVFQELMEQEHHMRIYVESYRYIKSMESDGRDGFDEDVRQILFDELDDCYRDYFYGKADKPKTYVLPAASASPDEMKFTTYSFMKKSVDGQAKPYPIARLSRDIKQDGQQIDIFDIGGCGCDYGDSCEID